MKIAMIAPPWLPVPAPGYGGTEAVVDALTRGLAAAGHDVLLIGHPDSTCPVERAWVVPAADATALLNPIQWNEPFGMATLEALACGTPVVGCPRGAMPEIVVHGVTGYLAETDDDLVAGVLAASDLDREACRAHVRNQFSVGRMVAGYVAVYAGNGEQRAD